MKGPVSELIVDPVDGIISRKFHNGEFRSNIGTPNNAGYMVIRMNGKTLLAHRIIYSHFHGPIPDWLQIDHIDGNPKNNKIDNLRLVTCSGNQQNLRAAKSSNETSGMLGVHWNKATGTWRATITLNRKGIHLGLFPTACAAHQAYLDAKRRLHSTCSI